MTTTVSAVAEQNFPALEILDTPNTPTIDSLVDVLNSRFGGGFAAGDTLKNILLMADGQPISVLVPGDREVDLKRLEANLSGVQELRLFEESDFSTRPELVKGYVGPQDASKLGLKLYADPRVALNTSWVTGANIKDRHARNVVNGRDFKVEKYVEAAEVKQGDACPECNSEIIIDRAIEIGHIFQLGRKYAEALNLTVLDSDGKQRVLTMGSYGVGVSRAVAAVAEQWHDELGLVWPREIAPADIHLVAAGKEDHVFEKADQIAAELESKGLRVLFDDRKDVSPGVKFKDAELIGVPTIVVVGKGLANGVVEVRDRKSSEKKEIPVDGVITHLMALHK
jgi:prolyl-tRNA synthetase